MNELPSWAGTLPGWITASSLLTMLGMWLRYLTQRRTQDGERLGDLETENRLLRSDFDKYRRECVNETDELRARIRALEDAKS